MKKHNAILFFVLPVTCVACSGCSAILKGSDALDYCHAGNTYTRSGTTYYDAPTQACLNEYHRKCDAGELDRPWCGGHK